VVDVAGGQLDDVLSIADVLERRAIAW
jgi:hypothetical protein